MISVRSLLIEPYLWYCCKIKGIVTKKATIGKSKNAILKVFKYVILIFRSHVKVTFYSFLLLGKLYYTII